MVYIIKKDGTKEEFDASKIKRAVNKSAGRVMYRFTDDEINFICKYATDRAEAMSKERKGGILIGYAQHCGRLPGTGESCSSKKLP